MVIGFTGHRDRTIEERALLKILIRYPGATWVHGGAIGFDTQVDDFAKAHGFEPIVIPPDYERYGRYRAPHVRNRQIVDMSDRVYGYYDGRSSGGTKATMEYAKKQGKPVFNLWR